MPAVAYQKAVAVVPARIDVARGCQLSKASAKSCKTAARFLSIMKDLNVYFSQKLAFDGLIPLEATKWGAAEK